MPCLVSVLVDVQPADETWVGAHPDGSYFMDTEPAAVDAALVEFAAKAARLEGLRAAGFRALITQIVARAGCATEKSVASAAANAAEALEARLLGMPPPPHSGEPRS
jgi:hypothetical protein